MGQAAGHGAQLSQSLRIAGPALGFASPLLGPAAEHLRDRQHRGNAYDKAQEIPCCAMHGGILISTAQYRERHSHE
jgi:hypothetical protein